MADIICRWRNASIKQVLEFSSIFPGKTVSKEDGRTIVNARWETIGGNSFFTTPYQLAAQMGMYYEDDGMMYSRFNSPISIEEATDYMSFWGKHYYAPNPYTKSLDLEQKPVILNNYLVNWVLDHENALLSEALSSAFPEALGNLDIITNMLNSFSEVNINDDVMTLKATANGQKYSVTTLEADAADKVYFFNYVGSGKCSKENIVATEIYRNAQMAPFIGYCIQRFLEYDDNMSRAKFKINPKTVGVEGCSFGKLKQAFDQETDTRHLDDCDKSILWTVEDNEYYYYKQLNHDSFVFFKDYFNQLYRERYKIVETSNEYIMYELTIVRSNSSLQTIYFGAPGTGKSFEAKKQTIGKPHIRTIFHPDSDYASFIGCYKPVMENGKIVYKYRAQAFINAYINAWQTNEPYYLVIEEINRGNCAQIFGDIFQLLDRTDGESDYDVYPDVDLQQYIKDTFTAAKNEDAEKFNNLSIPEEILSGAVMRLPKNLSIIATMNTSDQSLFPMDSAFKRRWEWKYFAIKDEGKGFKIKIGDDGKEYDWWKTIEAINKKILAATKSSDKQIGYWFAKLPREETVIDAERFVSKVVFYLWNDVFKDYGFSDNNPFTRETTFEAFFDARGNVVNDVVKKFLDRNCPTE